MCLLKVEIERNIQDHSAPDVREDPISLLHAHCCWLWQRLLLQHAHNCPTCRRASESTREVCVRCSGAQSGFRKPRPPQSHP